MTLKGDKKLLSPVLVVILIMLGASFSASCSPADDAQSGRVDYEDYRLGSHRDDSESDNDYEDSGDDSYYESESDDDTEDSDYPWW